MKIKIPDELFQEFLNYLQVSQSFFTEKDFEKFSESEREVFSLVDQILLENLER